MTLALLAAHQPTRQPIHQTDWLASEPIFYNQVTGAVSQNINDVIDLVNLEIDPDGLADFLAFGHAAFAQTPVKNVKLMRHSSQLFPSGNQTWHEVHQPDPVLTHSHQPTSDRDVLDLLQSKIEAWERSTTGHVVIPTSASHDSRLLSFMLRDKSRIRSFTFGQSPDQTASNDVAAAAALAEKLHTWWEHVQLGKFHHYLNPWDNLFGPATSARNLHLFEFYHQISHRLHAPTPLLTSLFGSAWSGTSDSHHVQSPSDLHNLPLAASSHADPAMSLLKPTGRHRQAYFESHRNRLSDPAFRAIEAVRFNMIQLSQHLSIPKFLGLQPWSPFACLDIAMCILNLPSHRRHARAWQRDFLAKHRLRLEPLNQSSTAADTLHLQGLRRVPLPPLNEQLLREVIQPHYLRWINRNISRFAPLWAVAPLCRSLPLLNKLSPGATYHQTRSAAYHAYATLKPIESLLRRRDLARAADPGNDPLPMPFPIATTPSSAAKAA